ncbi:MAG: lytic transglycosylase domain-containing protein [Alphaproteobacteria bacterium]|nr:lytic transglycosylase domain-containing protein [Alphaproteobacteria bacterium]
MKPPNKAAMLAIIMLMMLLNVSMLAKLVDRLESRYLPRTPEAQNKAPVQELPIPAQGAQELPPPGNETKSAAHNLAMCLIDASHAYEVPPAVMIGILHVESGRVGRESGPNDDGSYDLGPMQINTLWVPELARAWRVPERKARAVLRDDGCMNVKVAAWILRKNIKDAGSVYGGIKRYHSTTPIHGSRYAAKVYAAMEEKGLIRRN